MLSVNIFKLAYRLRTFVKDFFTSILFNRVVMATVYFSWYFTYEKTVPVPQANERKKILIYFYSYTCGTTEQQRVEHEA